MDLSAFVSALLRRWYLTVSALIATAGVTFLVVMLIGPTYKADGAVLLFPPASTVRNSTSVETQGNPYLVLGGLSQARDILMRTMRTKTAVNAFASRQPNAQYEVNPDFTTSAPILVITVSSPSAEDSIRGLNDVMQTVPETLRSLQSGIVGLPSDGYITSVVLTTDTKPETVRSDQIRSGIVVGAAVLLVMLLLLALVDGLLMARATRRRLAVEASDATGQPQLPDEPGDPPPADRPNSSGAHARRAQRVGR